MDVIDATIDSHDMRALDQDVTLEWPVRGMACHVKGCTTSRFKDFSLMQKHWSRIHQPTQTFFCCPLGRHCFDAITRTLVRRHMKQRHPSLGLKLKLLEYTLGCKLCQSVRPFREWGCILGNLCPFVKALLFTNLKTGARIQPSPVTQVMATKP